jgi:hypothetical protein
VVDADELDPGDVVTDYGASVTVPEPGISVTANVLYQDGSEELTATTALNGDVTLSDVGDESSGSAVASGATLTPFAGIAACDDDAYGLEGMYWAGTFNWYLAVGSIPGNLDVSNTTQALRDAGTNITTLNNSCGFADNVSASISYQGTTTTSVNMDSNATCGSGDGTSVTGFGTLPGGSHPALGATCVWSQTCRTCQYRLALESDLRLNKISSVPWTNQIGTCAFQYIVEDVATHERGHSFGLDDLLNQSHQNLSMYQGEDWCSTKVETLGLGDVLGLRVLY